MAFAQGSPCQNILVHGIVVRDTARSRHRVYVDRVTKYCRPCHKIRKYDTGISLQGRFRATSFLTRNDQLQDFWTFNWFFGNDRVGAASVGSVCPCSRRDALAGCATYSIVGSPFGEKAPKYWKSTADVRNQCIQPSSSVNIFSLPPRFRHSTFNLQIGHWPAQAIPNAEAQSVICARLVGQADRVVVDDSVSAIRPRAPRPLAFHGYVYMAMITRPKNL